MKLLPRLKPYYTSIDWLYAFNFFKNNAVEEFERKNRIKEGIDDGEIIATKDYLLEPKKDYKHILKCTKNFCRIYPYMVLELSL